MPRASSPAIKLLLCLQHKLLLRIGGIHIGSLHTLLHVLSHVQKG